MSSTPVARAGLPIAHRSECPSVAFRTLHPASLSPASKLAGEPCPLGLLMCALGIPSARDFTPHPPPGGTL